MSRIISNSKVLVSIIAVLLIANIAWVVFYTTRNQPPPKMQDRTHDQQGRERFSFILKNEVKFNEEQMKQFDSLKKEHWTAFKPLLKGINNSKDEFYQHLKDSIVDEKMLRSASDSIAIRQRIMDMQVFAYFRKIRDLCTPEQKPKFDSVAQSVVKRMIGGGLPQKKGDNVDPRRK